MDSERDLISDLPQSIIEAILVKVPIRDAVMTSALSTKWRYKWSSITELVFDDSSYLPNTPDIDQWLLFLSRKDVKELSIELGEGEWFKAPSYFFSCKKLTHLELVRCELDPPLNFKGFMCLKHLNLQQVVIPPCDIENLISSCPLLENLELSYFDSLELTIRAPKLRYLNLEGEFKEICLENTPNLVGISVAMYMTDDIAEHFEQSSGCNFDKFLGNVPLIEHLTGHIYFTKVLELYQVSFEDMKEIYVVLRLILSSPNLEQLLISGSTITASTDIHDLEIWEKGLPADCTFHKLKIVKISDFSAVLHEMAFIKFLLLNSPVLESMTIAPSFCIMDGKLKMLIELLSYRRTSPLATIKFVQEQA
nr:F-box/FBD/LRR-repeat protein At1g13570-like [Ipomoea batatas]